MCDNFQQTPNVLQTFEARQAACLCLYVIMQFDKLVMNFQTLKPLIRLTCRRQPRHLCNSNPKQWWQNIKKLTGQTAPNYVIGMANELCDSNVQQLTNNINVFLQSVSGDLAPLSPDLIPPISHCPDEFIIEPYTVERKLSKLNTNKSCGPDNIPNWILRDSSVWLAEPVCAIFNASVRDGVVPIIWKKANVVPVPKTNPPRKIESDLRPISST